MINAFIDKGASSSLIQLRYDKRLTTIKDSGTKCKTTEDYFLTKNG